MSKPLEVDASFVFHLVLPGTHQAEMRALVVSGHCHQAETGRVFAQPPVSLEIILVEQWILERI